MNAKVVTPPETRKRQGRILSSLRENKVLLLHDFSFLASGNQKDKFPVVLSHSVCPTLFWPFQETNPMTLSPGEDIPVQFSISFIWVSFPSFFSRVQQKEK
jgi:hypothetical protein